MIRALTRFLSVSIFSALVATPVWADPPQVQSVALSKDGMGWVVSVTLLHPDEGWDHYADAWQILDKDGTVLATRELMHPHVKEQPFTRSLRDVTWPDGTRAIQVRARCSKDGWSSTPTIVPVQMYGD